MLCWFTQSPANKSPVTSQQSNVFACHPQVCVEALTNPAAKNVTVEIVSQPQSQVRYALIVALVSC